MYEYSVAEVAEALGDLLKDVEEDSGTFIVIDGRVQDPDVGITVDYRAGFKEQTGLAWFWLTASDGRRFRVTITEEV